MEESVKIKLSTYLELQSRIAKADHDYLQKSLEKEYKRGRIFGEFLELKVWNLAHVTNPDIQLKELFQQFLRSKNIDMHSL